MVNTLKLIILHRRANGGGKGEQPLAAKHPGEPKQPFRSAQTACPQLHPNLNNTAAPLPQPPPISPTRPGSCTAPQTAVGGPTCSCEPDTHLQVAKRQLSGDRACTPAQHALPSCRSFGRSSMVQLSASCAPRLPSDLPLELDDCLDGRQRKDSVGAAPRLVALEQRLQRRGMRRQRSAQVGGVLPVPGRRLPEAPC